jgi:Domain of unknown function (DUF4390)
VDTTVFITPCWLKRLRWISSVAAVARLSGAWCAALCLLIGLGFAATAHAVDGTNATINSIRVERSDEGFYLSAALQFELPQAVEEALLKGVPITFVSEVQVYRDRWYWYDKRVASATRTVRLAYQPLTRRWRLGVASGTVASPATGISLTQQFDSLGEALATVRRVARWKIADAADLDAQGRFNVEYSFKLDLAQLPRPLQIGVTGQSDWNINVQQYLRPETAESR